jgi:hypothetical protein
VRQIHIAISGALSAAVRWEWSKNNPAAVAKKPHQAAPEPDRAEAMIKSQPRVSVQCRFLVPRYLVEVRSPAWEVAQVDGVQVPSSLRRVEVHVLWAPDATSAPIPWSTCVCGALEPSASAAGASRRPATHRDGADVVPSPTHAR